MSDAEARMRSTFLAVLTVLLVACASSPSSTCVPGASVACTCSNGNSGAQVCAADKTLGPCMCTASGSGGSGATTGSGGTSGGSGTTGAGGAVGRGGSGGTTAGGGGSGSGGTGGGQSVTGNFTVVYNNDITRNLTNCYSCSAVVTSTGGAIYTYDMDDGHTILSISLQSQNGGYNVQLYLTEGNASLSAMYRGAYEVPYTPQASSCVHFSALTVQTGGATDGTINCQIPVNSPGGSNQVPATITGTFHAVFPP
jgi:hypothetical protein